MSRRISPGGRGATSKQRNSSANFAKRLAAVKSDNNTRSMKTITGFALAMVLSVIIPQARLSAEETQSADMRLYPPATIQWKEGPAALPPGAKMAVLEGDPTKEGPFVVRFQFPDAYHIAPHTHPKTERVTVISGNLYLATGETLDRANAKKLPSGSFGYWPAGMKHAGWSEGET